MNKPYLLSEFVYCFLVLSWKPIIVAVIFKRAAV